MGILYVVRPAVPFAGIAWFPISILECPPLYVCMFVGGVGGAAGVPHARAVFPPPLLDFRPSMI